MALHALDHPVDPGCGVQKCRSGKTDAGLPSVPFKIQLHRRHGDGSQCFCIAKSRAIRFAPVRTSPPALNEKCPKLHAWSRNGEVSVLVLESNDIQHANCVNTSAAIRRGLDQRNDQPDVVLLVETDGSPMFGWVLKDRLSPASQAVSTTVTTAATRGSGADEPGSCAILNRQCVR